MKSIGSNEWVAQVAERQTLRTCLFLPLMKGKRVAGAPAEKLEVEYLKFREALPGNADGNPEPSPVNREGAETRRGKPKFKKPVQICANKDCTVYLDMVKRESSAQT
jgi:hypothetical protein